MSSQSAFGLDISSDAFERHRQCPGFGSPQQSYSPRPPHRRPTISTRIATCARDLHAHVLGPELRPRCGGCGSKQGRLAPGSRCVGRPRAGACASRATRRARRLASSPTPKGCVTTPNGIGRGHFRGGLSANGVFVPLRSACNVAAQPHDFMGPARSTPAGSTSFSRRRFARSNAR
jgi:hypothetical protein